MHVFWHRALFAWMHFTQKPKFSINFRFVAHFYASRSNNVASKKWMHKTTASNWLLQVQSPSNNANTTKEWHISYCFRNNYCCFHRSKFFYGSNWTWYILQKAAHHNINLNVYMFYEKKKKCSLFDILFSLENMVLVSQSKSENISVQWKRFCRQKKKPSIACN